MEIRLAMIGLEPLIIFGILPPILQFSPSLPEWLSFIFLASNKEKNPPHQVRIEQRQQK